MFLLGILLLFFGNIPLYEVVADPQGGRLYAPESGMNHGQGIRNIEEDTGLFLCQNFMDSVIDLFPLISVKGPPALKEQAIELLILIGDEVELSLLCL